MNPNVYYLPMLLARTLTSNESCFFWYNMESWMIILVYYVCYSGKPPIIIIKYKKLLS